MFVARRLCGCALGAVLDMDAHPYAVESYAAELEADGVPYTTEIEERETIGREPCATHAPAGWTGPLGRAKP